MFNQYFLQMFEALKPKLKFVLKPIVEDGFSLYHCLFYPLFPGRYKSQKPDSHKKLVKEWKEKTIKLLKNYKSKISEEYFKGKPFDEYIQELESDKIRPGKAEI
mmetsp:Transcript_21916/g.18809  ORF Transcript_21916/g.18809 Transcript_21916/m.18809 type:complete len:104 (+) Transcript_21916:648-959(+)